MFEKCFEKIQITGNKIGKRARKKLGYLHCEKNCFKIVAVSRF